MTFHQQMTDIKPSSTNDYYFYIYIVSNKSSLDPDGAKMKKKEYTQIINELYYLTSKIVIAFLFSSM